MKDDYNPLDDAPLEPTELERLEQENWKLRLKMIDAYIVVKDCIDMLEKSQNGIAIICLKKLKEIEL